MNTFPYDSLGRAYTCEYPEPLILDSGVESDALAGGVMRVRDALGQPVEAFDCLIQAVTTEAMETFRSFYLANRAKQFYWHYPDRDTTYISVFDPKNPPQITRTAGACGWYDLRWRILPILPYTELAGDTSQTFYGGDAMIDVINLAAGADIADLPVYAAAQDMVITSAFLLSKGTPEGVDDSNTVVIAVKDADGNTLLTKTYNAGTQPPTEDADDLTSLLDDDYTTLTAGDHLTLSVTQGVTANMPAFSLVFGGYYT